MAVNINDQMTHGVRHLGAQFFQHRDRRFCWCHQPPPLFHPSIVNAAFRQVARSGKELYIYNPGKAPFIWLPVVHTYAAW
jgi:hypothetical protein